MAGLMAFDITHRRAEIIEFSKIIKLMSFLSKIMSCVFNVRYV